MKKIIFLMLFIILVSAFVYADKVYLKDGRVLEGDLSVEGDHYKLVMKHGIATFKFEEVEKVVYEKKKRKDILIKYKGKWIAKEEAAKRPIFRMHIKDWKKQIIELKDTRFLEDDNIIQLANDLGKFHYIFRSSRYEDVVDLKVFEGMLYTLTKSKDLKKGEISSFDYKSRSHKLIHSFESINCLRCIGQALYVTGAKEKHPYVAIYEERKFRRFYIHGASFIYDVIKFKDNLYAAAQILEKDKAYAGIFVSIDDGKTWKASYKTNISKSKETWCLELIEYKGRLFGTERSGFHGELGYDVISFDGKKWERLDIISEKSSIYRFGKFSGFLFISGEFGRYYNHITKIGGPVVPKCFLWDGKKCEGIKTFFGKPIKGFAILEDEFYAITHLGYIYKTKDGRKWYYVTRLPKELFGKSLASYYGRLYAGTGGNGEVYVSGVKNKGNIISCPMDFGYLKDVVFKAKAILPKNSKVLIQVRTSADKKDLSKKKFVGFDGTPRSFFYAGEVPLNTSHNGDRFLQFKVYFETQDQKHTPILEEIQIENFSKSE